MTRRNLSQIQTCFLSFIILPIGSATRKPVLVYELRKFLVRNFLFCSQMIKTFFKAILLRSTFQAVARFHFSSCLIAQYISLIIEQEHVKPGQ